MRILKAAPAHISDLGGVAFEAEHRSQRLWCEISPEALADHFGADYHDPDGMLKAFQRNRTRISEVAMVKLPSRVAANRVPVLWSDDFANG